SYLQYILNRIDFGDQAPLAFGFTDGQGRLDFDLTPRHALSVTYLDGTSVVDRSRYRSELSASTVMTSHFHSSALNVGSRYTTSRLLIATHAAWSHEEGGYVQESLTYAKGRLAAGVRRDAHNLSPVPVTTPYASVSFAPQPKVRLEFDWGEYAQFPELNQSLSRFAAGRLLPERATH